MSRPKLKQEQRLTEKVALSFTASQMKELMHLAADAPGGPFTVREWALKVLLGEIKR